MKLQMFMEHTIVSSSTAHSAYVAGLYAIYSIFTVNPYIDQPISVDNLTSTTLHALDQFTSKSMDRPTTHFHKGLGCY